MTVLALGREIELDVADLYETDCFRSEEHDLCGGTAVGASIFIVVGPLVLMSSLTGFCYLLSKFLDLHPRR